MKNTKKSAFTLVEILAALVVVGLVIVGVMNINFNAISDKKRIDKTTVQLASSIETIRNNSLLGKGIGTNLEVPRKYKIDFGSTGSGDILIYYSTGVIDNYILLNIDNGIDFGEEHTHITQLKCLSLDTPPVTHDTITSGTGTIIFEGPNQSLGGDCTNAASKILEIEVQRKAFTGAIQINTLNGNISIK